MLRKFPIGLLAYELLVVRIGHFFALAGAVALAIIAMPVIVRTTEDMLNLVPQGMKDASTAMGAYPWRTITGGLLILRPARAWSPACCWRWRESAGRRRRAIVHRAQQSVLEHEPACAHGQSAGGDLPVRAQSVSELAEARLGRALLITASILLLSIIARARGLAPESGRQTLMQAPKKVRTTAGGVGQSGRRSEVRGAAPEFLLRPAAGAQGHQPRTHRPAITAFIGPRAAASQRCCASSTACTRSTRTPRHG